MKKIVYADNAATTRLDNKALESMLPLLEQEYGNASQPYSFARNVKKYLSNARKTIADCINANPEEIFFTSGGTESDNWALKGVMWGKPNSMSVITSEFEHHAILNSCLSLKELGYKISYIAPSNEGYINVDSLKKLISPDTAIVSIMMVNNELGTIQPIKELCEEAHKNGILFHTDAVQAIGHIKVDVKELDIDMLSASAHKFNGPKGIGFLYVKTGTKLHSLLDGGMQERSLRAGTENVVSAVGMAEALQQNCKNLELNYSYIKSLENMLLEMLYKSNIHFTVNGGTRKIPGLLSLSFQDKDGEAILHRLDLMGIEVSTGAACDSINTQVSHVLKTIKLDERLAKGTIRISLGKYNQPSDIEAIVNGLKSCLEKDI